MDTDRSRRRADRVSAWAVGVGVGLIVMMLTWLVGNRLAALAWDVPLGPTVAVFSSLGVGAITSVVVGLRLERSVRR
jgi:hypothetical protein